MRSSYTGERMTIGGRTAFVSCRVDGFLSSNELAAAINQALARKGTARETVLDKAGIEDLEIAFQPED